MGASACNVIHMALQYGMAQQPWTDGNFQCYWDVTGQACLYTYKIIKVFVLNI